MVIKKMQLLIKILIFFIQRQMRSDQNPPSWLLYLLLGSFIMGWWMLAFRPNSSAPLYYVETSQSLALQTSALLNELSPLQREVLQRALAGHVPSMLNFINQWDQDALLLAKTGTLGIQRLSAQHYRQAQILGHLLLNSSQDSLRQLNCKMNLEWMCDDNGQLLQIKDSFQQFLPQTYLAASFLLAIAHPSEILALPKGLRHLKQLYSLETLAQIPSDIDRIYSERLSLKKPDLAFVAPYSHPPALEVLRNQNIHLYSLQHVNTIEEIQNALLKIGHASNHILEAQLLVIFMDACLLSIDNRLRALQNKFDLSQHARRFLYLSYHQHYTMPTIKCLTGQLMTRALKYCPHLLGFIPENRHEWRICCEQEHILQTAPDVMIISTSSPSPSYLNRALQQTQAFKSQQIFYVDEAIQDSPTQYIVLAYFDLFQALAATYTL